MGDFRARDADRDRYVEVIEAAYVDGQLGDADRELRVSRALTAETLDELDILTRDLQNRPAPVAVPEPVAHASPRPSPQPTALRRGPRASDRRGVAVVAGVGVAAALAAVLMAGTGGLPETDSGFGPAPSVQAEPVQPARTFAMDVTGVRDLLRRYERKFDTQKAYEVAFYPGRVAVQVPVDGSRPRAELWSWDGTWRQDTQASRVTGPVGTVDLGSLDVERLFDNIETALQTLQVEDGKLTHVLVSDWGQGPSVNIYIGNQYGETGYLRTEPGGEIIRSYPYDA